MLEKLKEMSINLWSPVGEIFSSISETSNTWFPIIAYMVITIVLLILLKKILDMSVSSASSLSLKIIWPFVKKLLLYIISISLSITIIVSLYFYFESLYTEHQKETIRVEESVDYLLLR